MRRTIFFLLVSFIFLVACGTNDDVQNRVSTGVGSVSSGDNPLRIPELIDGRETPDIEIVMQKGAHEFYAGIPSETKGFNGDYLGPAIRLYDGGRHDHYLYQQYRRADDGAWARPARHW